MTARQLCSACLHKGWLSKPWGQRKEHREDIGMCPNPESEVFLKSLGGRTPVSYGLKSVRTALEIGYQSA